MTTHVVWEMDSSGEFVRSLFVGTEAECCEVVSSLYEIAIDLADPSWWKSVVVDVLANDGDAWVDGGIVEVGDFAWFRNRFGVLIWGEVSAIIDAGDELDGVRVSVNTVVIYQGHQIGDLADSDEVAPWAMDLSKCSGVGSVGLVSL